MNIEKTLNIKFSKQQKRHATALRWLLTDGKAQKNRQTGRTTLFLALAVERALKNKGREIILADPAMIQHGQWHAMTKNMLLNLNHMLKRSAIPAQNIKINPNRPSLTIY
jgi:hypothetical protein